MAKKRLIRHEEARQKKWKSSEYRRAYRLLKPRYDIVRELINLRHHNNITQQELAKRLDTHQSRISTIESADHDIRFSTLIELADALNADVEIRLIPRLEKEIYSEILNLLTKPPGKQTWSTPKVYGITVKGYEITSEEKVLPR